MRTVFLDFDTVSHDDVSAEALRIPGIELVVHGVTPASAVADRCRDAGIVIVNKVNLDAALLESAADLRLVCLAATGTNNVDIEAARRLGVAVCNIEAYCTASVVQHVFAVILALTHHLHAYQVLLQQGAWKSSPQFCLLDFPIRELAGKTLGIVGLGELGSAVARVAEAFGMRVQVARRPGGETDDPERIPLYRLLAEADVISLHCPLTASTRGMIGAAELERMKPDALLINTARGALVDSAALADALKAGRIGGAGIDVLPEEPPVSGDPLLDPAIPNLIVTPHIAWAAREARQRAVDEIAANIRSFLDGGRRGRVD
ncbi:MAG: D-2-hydroxyacid dehydrogenase [Gammaproteobacteria bacterium]|jgi:glycerate dehydrogenase